MRRKLALILLHIVISVRLYSQTDTLPDRFEKIPVKDFVRSGSDEALTDRVAFANGSREDIRQTPSNMMVFSADQISASGARDLLEFLRFVPGVNIVVGTDDLVGLGIKGLCASEGRYLVLFDGVPLNEYDYGTFPLGQRLQLNHVSRIEILLGPSTLVYGNSSALGVINVISKSVSETEGVFVEVLKGIGREGSMRQNISLYGNHLTQNQTEISYFFNMGGGSRSQYVQETAMGPRPLADSTQITSSTAYIRVANNGLSAKVLFDNYDYDISNAPHAQHLRIGALEFELNKKINPSIPSGLH